ncbi:MAG: MBOAT family protein [Bacteroidaceae bacterium]|nr:MBOAT family protein [Bacteroidaceae bacterium]
MIFNSFQFLWLFPIIFVIYYCISWICGRGTQGKVSNTLLLLVSYALYIQWEPWCALVLLWVTFITYIGARAISKHILYGKSILWICVVLGISPLLIFKYNNFAIETLNSLLSISSVIRLEGLNWAIPIGISFFSFQAVGYLIDVYKKKISAEKNFLNYALFVSFFPQIMSGPISRAEDLLPQIKAKRTFDYSKAVQGLKWLLWGMFLKVVMADRLGIYVDSVYNNYVYQSGLSCFVASLCYTMQIYGDFAGYSLMAIGVGRLMGFDLVNNFNRPYFASSIAEFWKKWHISLTRWLTTYIYIGLGGNKCSKVRQYFNIMITFLVSGIWHGANWTFILWGIMHGLLQCFEKFFGIDPKGKYYGLLESKFFLRSLRVLCTFLLVNFAWILFRLPSIEVTEIVFKKIFLLEGNGLFLPNNSAIGFMIISLSIVIGKEVCEEYFPKIQLYNNKNAIVRWGSYIITCIIIMLCGVFDSGQFIYVKF